MILGELSASTLHKMSSTEMSSMEKMEWRTKQRFDDLEQIKKIEEQKQKEVIFLDWQKILKELICHHSFRIKTLLYMEDM